MYNMGIKSFFRNLGRGIKRGFEKFVSGAGNVIGGAGEYIQRTAIPAIASGATKAAGLLDKGAPLLDAAGPEAAAAGAEASQVLGQVGAGVGKFAKFIGSDVANKPPVMANAQQILAFGQSPFGMAIRRSQGFAKPISASDAASYAAGVKPKPELPPATPSSFKSFAAAFKPGLISPAPKQNFMPNPLKAVGMPIKPLIGSNPASYTPSGIEAKPANQDGSVKVAGGGASGAPMLSM